MRPELTALLIAPDRKLAAQFICQPVRSASTFQILAELKSLSFAADSGDSAEADFIRTWSSLMLAPICKRPAKSFVSLRSTGQAVASSRFASANDSDAY